MNKLILFCILVIPFFCFIFETEKFILLNGKIHVARGLIKKELNGNKYHNIQLTTTFYYELGDIFKYIDEYAKELKHENVCELYGKTPFFFKKNIEHVLTYDKTKKAIIISRKDDNKEYEFKQTEECFDFILSLYK